MSIVFSTITFFGLIVTAAAGIAWVIGKLRHRETKARIVCIAAALVTVISFVAFGVTHDPAEWAEEPPAAESTPPAATSDVSPAPDVIPEPSTPEPSASEEPTPTPEPTPEPTPPPASDPQPEPTPEEPVTAPVATPTPEEPPAEESPAEEADPVEQAKQEIEEAARQIIADHYTQTDIDNVTVNEDYGTDADGDYILLVYLTWNVENSARMTKKVLAMYSEDFAARVGESMENVQEVALFWTVPYHIEDGTAVKYSYERRGAGMYQTDSMIMIQD